MDGVDLALNEFPSDPNEPNDSFATATEIALDSATTGNVMIHPTNDMDFYRFTLEAATVIDLRTGPVIAGALPATDTDTTMILYFGNGAPIALNDDFGGVGTYSRLTGGLPAGDYIVGIAIWPRFTPPLTSATAESGIGLYRLSLSAVSP